MAENKMTKEVLKAAKGTGSVEELQKLAKENGITPITLGKRILRISPENPFPDRFPVLARTKQKSVVKRKYH